MPNKFERQFSQLVKQWKLTDRKRRECPTDRNVDAAHNAARQLARFSEAHFDDLVKGLKNPRHTLPPAPTGKESSIGGGMVARSHGEEKKLATYDPYPSDD